jgi:hypothetical protein
MPIIDKGELEYYLTQSSTSPLVTIGALEEICVKLSESNTACNNKPSAKQWRRLALKLRELYYFCEAYGPGSGCK